MLHFNCRARLIGKMTCVQNSIGRQTQLPRNLKLSDSRLLLQPVVQTGVDLSSGVSRRKQSANPPVFTPQFISCGWIARERAEGLQDSVNG